MIYSTYLSKIKEIPDSEKIVLITRFAPPSLKQIKKLSHGFIECAFGDRKVFLNQYLAPSSFLLNSFKKNNDWDEYKRRFIDEMNSSDESMYLINRLARSSATKDTYIVCMEKDYTHCHRTIVRNMIEELGVETQEFQSK